MTRPQTVLRDTELGLWEMVVAAPHPALRPHVRRPGDPKTWGDVRQAVSVRIADPDVHFGRAKAAGAAIVMSPFTTHYSARSYWARDPGGFLWGFSTYEPAGSV